MNNYETIQDPSENAKPIKAWVKGVQLEDAARQQLINVSRMPFIHHHLAVMPDVHWGFGATVGSVIPTLGAIIPAAVGVDIGCGMLAVQTSLNARDLPDTLAPMRSAIEAAVPHGGPGGAGSPGAWAETPANALKDWGLLAPTFKNLCDKHPALEKSNTHCHLGTLGTGNHFVEICLDESNDVWVMLHSGSRGVGNRIGTHFIELAKQDMYAQLGNLPDKDLAYFTEGAKHFHDYVEAVSWAQLFAHVNRTLMLRETVLAMAATLGRTFEFSSGVVNCHHNYVSREYHFSEDVYVTRKGAVDASFGQLGIIPGSMGTRSYIVRGKGNPESFNSCSHGAGRKMSRGAAKKAFTLEDHAAATAGVECRKDAGVIDETPGSYKDIDAVMAAQSDLVEVVHTLKQVLCVKG